MGIISEVKCGRCDRRYSGFRSRCPYCGARRNKRGKHADDSDNSRGKLIVGALLLLILIVAIVVLIVTSVGEKGDKPKDSKNENIVDINDDEVTSVPGSETAPKPGETDTIPPENEKKPEENKQPEVELNSVTLTYSGYALEDLDFSMSVGETLKLDYVTDPEETGLKAKWESSDTDVFVVKSDGTVTAVGEGTETLTLTVGDISVDCIVRVN